MASRFSASPRMPNCRAMDIVRVTVPLLAAMVNVFGAALTRDSRHGSCAIDSPMKARDQLMRWRPLRWHCPSSGPYSLPTPSRQTLIPASPRMPRVASASLMLSIGRRILRSAFVTPLATVRTTSHFPRKRTSVLEKRRSLMALLLVRRDPGMGPTPGLVRACSPACSRTRNQRPARCQPRWSSRSTRRRCRRRGRGVQP